MDGYFIFSMPFSIAFSQPASKATTNIDTRIYEEHIWGQVHENEKMIKLYSPEENRINRVYA